MENKEFCDSVARWLSKFDNLSARSCFVNRANTGVNNYNSSNKDIDVKQFIKEYLIKRIGKLRKDFPFESFILISVGIEFLGKCLQKDFGRAKVTKGNKHNTPKDDFNLAIKDFCTLKKYMAIPELYHNLRCGLAHRYMLNGENIELGKDKNDLVKRPYLIGCSDFYKDFKVACLCLLYCKCSAVVKENINSKYMSIKDSITASTKSDSSMSK